MSVSLGGLGLLSIRNPFAELVAIILGKGDIKSMFCLIVFSIVSLVLAYLTNPSENSFRAYLTEQSFRHHLSRLDDNADDTHDSRSRYVPRNSTLPTTSPFAVDSSPPFHFANRASISLRTPKHVFHSFAIFTVAAMVPLSQSNSSDSQDGWMISDSWYIGAFGKWWRGGVLEAWYQDVIARTKDEESWSSGILSMKRLDMLPDYNGSALFSNNRSSHLFRGSPPKLRNRERPILRHSVMQTRSSTPPPLPKSASLPMHTIRRPLVSIDRPCDHRLQQPHPHQGTLETSRHGPLMPSRSPSALFEHSPLIAEVLRQITNTKGSVTDLRNQLLECQSSFSQSHAVLQHEVDTHRERKRHEDASKVELKSRTKILEDSKRSAESMKKEADKKLKAIELTRENAVHRMEILDQEILQLQERLSEDRNFILDYRTESSDQGLVISETVQDKRLEIVRVEDSVTILNHRSRELEERLALDKGRLKLLREKSDSLKRGRSPFVQDRVQSSEELWQSQHLVTGLIRQDSTQSPSVPALQYQSRKTSEPCNDSSPTEIHQSTMSSDRQIAQECGIAAGGLPLDSSRVGTMTTRSSPSSNQGCIGIASDDVMGLGRTFPEHGNSNGMPSKVLEPVQDGLAPATISSRGRPMLSALVVPIERSDTISRSFQSDGDPFIAREWHGNTASYVLYQPDGLDSAYPTTTSSPNSLHGSSINDTDQSEFAARFPLDLYQAPWNNSHMKYADIENGRSSHGTTPSNGLNPDAKEFSLLREPLGTALGRGPLIARSTFDALNPNGFGSTVILSSSSTSRSLLRAFAPSPAEREALQKALGGSTNTSLERLPSLSDVSSMPSSPTTDSHPQHPTRDVGSILPSWLQAFPRTRKVKFSPWDDDEPRAIDKVSNDNVSWRKS
ncbi:hypothetical protein B0H34DRAFT_795869 [Crassisporium funariophilum]|nr:hypothetical protein B0H34DRAFT_795869 [Crassisporium funariophilum]